MILTFHFELRHVPGKVHRLDGLSRRPLQLRDLVEEEEDDPENFNNWVDNLYRFMHLLNPIKPVSQSAQLFCTFTMEEMRETDAETKAPIIDYKAVPWPEKALLVEI